MRWMAENIPLVHFLSIGNHLILPRSCVLLFTRILIPLISTKIRKKTLLPMIVLQFLPATSNLNYCCQQVRYLCPYTSHVGPLYSIIGTLPQSLLLYHILRWQVGYKILDNFVTVWFDRLLQLQTIKEYTMTNFFLLHNASCAESILLSK